MNYEELLKKAKKELPKEIGSEDDRFQPVQPSIARQGKLTIIKNFADIAKNLRRNKTDLAKYLFAQLGVKGALTGESLILNSSVDSRLLGKRIDEFTNEYVRCHECKKVDTKMSIKNKIAEIKCEACGAKKTAKW